jgi:pimeloyl-ACP methyl ester carboxylesterase
MAKKLQPAHITAIVISIVFVVLYIAWCVVTADMAARLTQEFATLPVTPKGNQLRWYRGSTADGGTRPALEAGKFLLKHSAVLLHIWQPVKGTDTGLTGWLVLHRDIVDASFTTSPPPVPRGRAAFALYDDETQEGAGAQWMRAWEASRVRRTVVFWHGNSGNLRSYQRQIKAWFRAGYNVVAWDYRGFGCSGRYVRGSSSSLLTKKPRITDTSVRSDVIEGMEWVCAHIPLHRVVIVGYSLGGHSAVHAAAHYTPSALVLESTFDELSSAARHMVPMLGYIPTLQTPIYQTWRTVPHVAPHIPVVVVHGVADEVVPYDAGMRLWRALTNRPKRTAPTVFFTSGCPSHIGIHSDARVMHWLSRHGAPALL